MIAIVMSSGSFPLEKQADIGQWGLRDVLGWWGGLHPVTKWFSIQGLEVSLRV